MGLQANHSALAVDESGRLCVSGFQLGTTAGSVPSLARWDGHDGRRFTPMEVPLKWCCRSETTYVGVFPARSTDRNWPESPGLDGTQWHPLGTGIGTRPTAVAALASREPGIRGGHTVVGPSLPPMAPMEFHDRSLVRPLGSGLPVEGLRLNASGRASSQDRRPGVSMDRHDWEGLGLGIGRWFPGTYSPSNGMAISHAAGNFGPAEGSLATVVLRCLRARWTRVSDDPITGSAISPSFPGGHLFPRGRIPNCPPVPGCHGREDRLAPGRLVDSGTEPTLTNPGLQSPLPGTELFALAAPTLRWAQNGTGPSDLAPSWQRMGTD